MKLTGNNILFKPFLSEAVTQGGLIVPETARKYGSKGVITGTSAGTPKKPMKLKEGMIAYRVKDWGEPFIIDDELHFLMDAEAIIAIE